MRKHILVLALGLLTSISFGQTIFSPGDIVVVAIDNEGYFSTDASINDNYGNGIYLLTLVDIPNGEKFRVSDNHYDSSTNSFSTDYATDKDGTVEWENDTGATIPAGTRIDIYFVQANFPPNIITNEGDLTRVFDPNDTGTSAAPNGRMKFENNGDAIYVYTVDGSGNPDVFITACTNEGWNADNGDLPSSLTEGLNALNLANNAHCAIYNGPETGFANYDDLRTAINSPINWQSESGTGNQSTDGIAPDIIVDVKQFLQPVLPIELLGFDVQRYAQDDVLIQWASAMELNNDYYEVERAGADLRFNTIETVDGAIESTEVLSYEVIDEQPLDGVNYYRLKQVDLDGTTSYFDVRSVDFGSDQQGLVFPNPVKGKIFISGESYLGAQYNVIDLSGAVKMTGVVTKEQLELSAEGLEEGIYFLQLVSKGTTHTYKFSKI